LKSKDGTLKEIFGAGTAAVVNPLLVSPIKMYYRFLEQLKDKLTNIQHKLAEDIWLDRKGIALYY
jgi:branched-chain amino acid aminotransferase